MIQFSKSKNGRIFIHVNNFLSGFLLVSAFNFVLKRTKNYLKSILNINTNKHENKPKKITNLPQTNININTNKTTNKQQT